MTSRGLERVGRRIDVRGVVQGVGFRPWVYRVARQLGVTGSVRNEAAGVRIEAFGSEAQLDALMAALGGEAPPAARIDRLIAADMRPHDTTSFVIASSDGQGERRSAIPADLATCRDCFTELFNPRARRFRYAFTNCTNCGPRFTIAHAVPYDRASTTMARFTMCRDCEREYTDPGDRRFHAEPIACPQCGPRLALLDNQGVPIACQDEIEEVGRIIERGGVVAIKGLGGFHLACDATSEAAVHALRQRKRRDFKPLAVMAPDLKSADALAEIGDVERALLTSAARPIVLALRRGNALAAEVAPETKRIGLILPYTPLHHLLMAEVGRPLVMTSGNLSEEPIAFENDDAVRRLGPLTDALLVHDRAIETRTDDSVVAVIAGRASVWRRSRGYVPEAVAVPVAFPEPVIAVGGHLKNTFCIGVDEVAYLGPHIGDLENITTQDSFSEALHHLSHFLGVRPRVIAHDLHPEYRSTRFATVYGGRLIGVQHHHAHIASVMAEHHLHEPVLGVAYDGTGYGTDGAAWGGEIMLAGLEGYRRKATLRPISLAGGDRAIREPWRAALALLDDAFDRAPPLDRLPLFSRLEDGDVSVIRGMIERSVNTAPAHGAGRYFDAFAALLLDRPYSHFEGQLAMALEQVAAPGPSSSFPFAIDRGRDPWQIDLRAAVREAVADRSKGVPVEILAARFHQTLIAATAAVLEALLASTRVSTVVLGGGCFQNARLTEGLLAVLPPGTRVHLAERVPPGDGGLALGQAVIAAAQLQQGGAGRAP